MVVNEAQLRNTEHHLFEEGLVHETEFPLKLKKANK